MILPSTIPANLMPQDDKTIAKNRKNMNFAGRAVEFVIICHTTNRVPKIKKRGITDNTIIYFINIGSPVGCL